MSDNGLPGQPQDLPGKPGTVTEPSLCPGMPALQNPLHGSDEVMTETDPRKQFDEHRGYCRLLGHEVVFAYCRIAKEGLPCFKILDCWYERLPVEDYIQTLYSPEERGQILARPAPKMTTLVDLINKARQRTQPE